MAFQGLTAYLCASSKLGRESTTSYGDDGARLKAIRNRADVTNDFVAKLLGIALSTYSSYEGGKRGKKPLPVPLVKGLIRVLVGRGHPPVTREELTELAGVDVLSDEEEEFMRALRRLPPERQELIKKLVATETKEKKS